MYQSYAREMPFSGKDWQDSEKYFFKTQGKGFTSDLYRRLLYSPININNYTESKNIVGLDTETLADSGNLLCLCCDNGDTLLADKPISIKDVFNFLDRQQHDTPNTIFFFYNLAFDVLPLLKTLTNKELDQFYDSKFEMEIDNIKIKYIKRKNLTLRNKDTKRSVIIYDALQFFNSSLERASIKFLGQHKIYTGKYQDKHFPKSIFNEPEELKQVIEYCILDAQLCKDLMQFWIGKFAKSFNFYPDKFYSCGYLAIQYLKTQLEQFSDFKSIPYNVHELAFKSYFGGRFEIFKRGYLPNVHHYDINSAYPYAMSKMPDFYNGTWIEIKTLEDFLKYQDNVGFYEVGVNVRDTDIAPFMYRAVSGLVYSPRGKFTTHTTNRELKIALSKFNVDLKKIKGYAFIPKVKGKTEFNKLIEYMYNERIKNTDDGQKYVYKVLINSLYGKTAQAKPKPRGIFNPVMCSYITGDCRATLLDVAGEHKESIHAFATDGIFSSELLNLPLSKKMGQFSYEYHKDFYMIMSGIYSLTTWQKIGALNYGYSSELQTKSRGFSIRAIDKTGKSVLFDPTEFRLQFDKEAGFYYHIKNYRPLTISQAVLYKKYDYSEIAKMVLRDRKINLNGDKKRSWLGRLRTINDYNESKTLSVNYCI